ncbi:hypothetical protein M9Y10_017151 [Tritrichomonas musculus]|uniref:Glycosyltransferase 2-like domain-containing protein n=1 Tax=Tritrichomonas musculus TaxID=1915356 RepID=A0ABR2HVI4_9EUKA
MMKLKTIIVFMIVNFSTHYICKILSVTVAVHNEEILIEDSISSIAPYVAEVIIIDHGSIDSTPKIIKNLTRKFSNIHAFHANNKLPFSELYNLGFLLTTKPWILRWGADYFLYPNAQKKICSLIDWGDKKSVNIINFGLPRIDGDMEHVVPYKLDGDCAEQRLFKRGYIITRQTYRSADENISPIINSKFSETKEVLILHAGSFKNAERLYYRRTMTPYLIYRNTAILQMKKPLTYWEWEFFRLKKFYPSKDEIQRFKHEKISLFCNETLVPFANFNFKKFGPHPFYLQSLHIFKLFKLKYVQTDANGQKLYSWKMPGCP